ncbi:MAG: ATP-binding cassette domain-containing protein [Phycisphaeraceae bacterium]|nr:ATP-binding cassette domain-containing protein [Phycisphaeraceae bacterium]
MDITLKALCPSFLTGTGSGVWGKDIHWPEKAVVNVAAPSGTGKTTFMSILYGLLSEYTGSLLFEGKDATSLSRRDWAQMRQTTLSLMFQDLRLFDQLTCVDNVLLKASQAKPVDSEDSAFIETAFERLGLTSRLKTLAGSCSQGEKQRVAFIRALVQPFDWILLDEPFSHLDDACIETMRDLLLEAKERNQAGLIVTSLAPDTWLTYDTQVAL